MDVVYLVLGLEVLGQVLLPLCLGSFGKVEIPWDQTHSLLTGLNLMFLGCLETHACLGLSQALVEGILNIQD